MPRRAPSPASSLTPIRIWYIESTSVEIIPNRTNTTTKVYYKVLCRRRQQ